MDPGRRAFVVIPLLLVIAAALPTSAAASWPDRPLPGYRPAFVSETVARPPWRDCLWATGAMLLDKWTAGRTTVSFQELHALGGDHYSSDFADVRHAFSQLGLSLTYSPNGGAFTTWTELLTRLKKGGGAILLGDYSKLPRYYGRFDPQFWRNEASSDDHALYLDGYDSKRHSVWVMDPLAPQGWAGQWIPVSDLVRYAWRTPGGGLWVAMTPAAVPAPFAGVTLGGPSAAVTTDRVVVSWPVEAEPKSWSPTGAVASATMTRITSGIVAVGPDVLIAPPIDPARNPTADPSPAGSPPAPGVVVDVAGSILTDLPIPTQPGVYRVTARIVEQRFGGIVASAGPYVLYVPGERRGTIGVDTTRRSAVSGQAVIITGYVANTGSTSWADSVPVVGGPMNASPSRMTQIWARWLSNDAALSALAPAAVAVQAVPLEPGAMTEMTLALAAPAQPGEWTLVLDIADTDGSFALDGNPPASIPVTVADAAWMAAPN